GASPRSWGGARPPAPAATAGGGWDAAAPARLGDCPRRCASRSSSPRAPRPGAETQHDVSVAERWHPRHRGLRGHYLHVIDSRSRPFDTRLMRSYQLDKLGSIDGIVLRERDEPKPGPTEILVRVHAASLNKRDSFIRAGTYPLPAKREGVPLSERACE